MLAVSSHLRFSLLSHPFSSRILRYQRIVPIDNPNLKTPEHLCWHQGDRLGTLSSPGLRSLKILHFWKTFVLVVSFGRASWLFFHDYRLWCLLIVSWLWEDQSFLIVLLKWMGKDEVYLTFFVPFGAVMSSINKTPHSHLEVWRTICDYQDAFLFLVVWHSKSHFKALFCHR